jgi:hypothetical protein
VHTDGVDDVTDFTPSPVVDTEGVNEPPTATEPGMFEISTFTATAAIPGLGGAPQHQAVPTDSTAQEKYSPAVTPMAPLRYETAIGAVEE